MVLVLARLVLRSRLRTCHRVRGQWLTRLLLRLLCLPSGRRDPLRMTAVVLVHAVVALVGGRRSMLSAAAEAVVAQKVAEVLRLDALGQKNREIDEACLMIC